MNIEFENSMEIEISNPKPELEIEFDSSSMEIEIKKEKWLKQQEMLKIAIRKNFVELGKTMKEINDAGDYKCDYPTFGSAMQDVFDFSAGRAYQLIDAYELFRQLSDAGITSNLLPINEGQCRALRMIANANAIIDKEDDDEAKKSKMMSKAIEIWRELIAGGKIPTAKQIAAYGKSDADDTDTTDADCTDDADTTAPADDTTDTKPISVVVAIRDFKKQLQVFEIKEDEKEKVKNRLQSLQREIKRIIKKLEVK